MLRPGNAAVILLIGPPGSGKSYFAVRLARRLAANLVQSDAIRKRLFPEPTYSSEEARVVFSEAHRQLEECLRAGGTAIFDATNLQETHRRPVYALAEKAGATLHLLWFAAPEELMARRLEARRFARDPEDLSDATWAIYRRLAPTAEAPSRPFTVLNAALSAEELADVVERGLQVGS